MSKINKIRAGGHVSIATIIHCYYLSDRHIYLSWFVRLANVK